MVGLHNEDSSTTGWATRLKRLPRAVWHRLVYMPLTAKFTLAFLCLFYGALIAFIVIVTPARIGQFLYDTAQRISGHPLGWLLLTGMIFLVSFPPAIGHSTVLNLCGFAYGIKGFAVAGPASLFGSAFAFIVLRYFFARRLARWSSTHEGWQALESVIQSKGLPLMVLIRVSPFPPWVYSNSLFASIRSVSLWQFMVATIFTFPRFLLYVFIGSRLAALADGEQRGKMDKTAKILNGVLVAGGILLGVAAGWIIYVQMQKQLKKVSPSAAEALHEADEGEPLLEDPDEYD
ncbi:unnamed protein product [Peniophora sp. CBMAI 1063]|nr:unnamed protein product [Peniophora sp. CBMAI 1063]